MLLLIVYTFFLDLSIYWKPQMAVQLQQVVAVKHLKILSLASSHLNSSQCF